MAFIEAIILIAVILFLFYKWSTRKFHILKERGVPHEKPTPFIGSIKIGVLFEKSSILKETINEYQKFKKHKAYGGYSFSDPMFSVSDLELIKKIGVKDFDHFVNHRSLDATENDSVMRKHLLALRDRPWKEMRTTLSPSFTGSKMRLMHELINDACLEAVQNIKDEIKAGNKTDIELELKDYFTRFANDVIGTVAFGIKINSFKDKNNQFYQTGVQLTKVRFIMLVKVILYTLMPKVMKSLGVSFMDQKVLGYFRSLVMDTIKYRQDHHIVRPDMIHLLLEAKREFEANVAKQGPGHATFDDDDLLAQCLIFFLAGFDTVSTCLCFTLYELAVNPDVQTQLYEEIVETETALEGKPLNYDVLTKMEYMELVLSESLRKWPPAIITDRMANDDYKLIDEDGKLLFEILKGEQVIIPIFALHHDPELFPDPEKFKPERFTKENEKDIKPYSYLPFGIGPRSCIGNRLALMETKSIVYHLIKEFKIEPTAKTPVDMLEAIKGFQMMPKEKFWIKFTPRTN